MNRIDNPVPCPCRRPGAYARYTDELEVGLTEDCWDITRTTCTRCGTTGLRAYLVDQRFPRAGRYYRAPVDQDRLVNLTASSAMDLIASNGLILAGGSRYSPVECRVEEMLRLRAAASPQRCARPSQPLRVPGAARRGMEQAFPREASPGVVSENGK